MSSDTFGDIRPPRRDEASKRGFVCRGVGWTGQDGRRSCSCWSGAGRRPCPWADVEIRKKMTGSGTGVVMTGKTMGDAGEAGDAVLCGALRRRRGMSNGKTMFEIFKTCKIWNRRESSPGRAYCRDEAVMSCHESEAERRRKERRREEGTRGETGKEHHEHEGERTSRDRPGPIWLRDQRTERITAKARETIQRPIKPDRAKIRTNLGRAKRLSRQTRSPAPNRGKITHGLFPESRSHPPGTKEKPDQRAICGETPWPCEPLVAS